MYCGHSFKSSLKGLPKVGSDHGWLTKAFSLLSLLLLFDQSLSGLHESIFERTGNGTLCSDDTHISGGFIYSISVAVWVFFLHCSLVTILHVQAQKKMVHYPLLSRDSHFDFGTVLCVHVCGYTMAMGVF